LRQPLCHRGFAGNHVDAVDRNHSQHIIALAVADAHRVLVAGLADHVGPPFMPVDGQLASIAAVVQADVGQTADRGRMGGKNGEQRRKGKFQGFHRPSSKCGYRG